jgi:gamma-polyglutamate biosynthesis protein CapA
MTDPSLTCCFSGDVGLTGSYRSAVLEGREIFDAPLLSTLMDTDFVVCNLEGPASERPLTTSRRLRVAGPPSSIAYLHERNIRVFNLANNHLFDCGADGFRDTRAQIDQVGALRFGAGETVQEASSVCLIERGGVRVALVGICEWGPEATEQSPGVFGLRSLDLLARRLREARESADWVVLSVHAGDEYNRVPEPAKRRLMRRLARLDADLIVGHHPHVLQGVEDVHGKRLFYSLGNFIFDMAAQRTIPFTEQSALLRLAFTKEAYSFDWIPVRAVREDAIVGVGEQSTIDDIRSFSDFSHPRLSFMREAHRAFFASLRAGGAKAGSETTRVAEDRAPPSLLRRLLSPGPYLWTLKALLGGPRQHPVFFATLAYILLRPLLRLAAFVVPSARTVPGRKTGSPRTER